MPRRGTTGGQGPPPPNIDLAKITFLFYDAKLIVEVFTASTWTLCNLGEVGGESWREGPQ